MIYFYVFNYSKVLEDVEIENHITSLFEYLRANGVEVEFRMEIVRGSLREEFDKYIKDRSKPFIEHQGVVSVIADFPISNADARNRRFVFVGEELKTQIKNEWGESIPNWIAVIKYIEKMNIWHEVAHLLGAEDHYDSMDENHKALPICGDPDKCIMTWGKEEGVLCEATLAEIRSSIRTLQG
jgi:hypothetical protein